MSLKLKRNGLFLAGLLVVALALIAAGCGGDDGGEAPEALLVRVSKRPIPSSSPDRQSWAWSSARETSPEPADSNSVPQARSRNGHWANCQAESDRDVIGWVT